MKSERRNGEKSVEYAGAGTCSDVFRARCGGHNDEGDEVSEAVMLRRMRSASICDDDDGEDGQDVWIGGGGGDGREDGACAMSLSPSLRVDLSLVGAGGNNCDVGQGSNQRSSIELDGDFGHQNLASSPPPSPSGRAKKKKKRRGGSGGKKKSNSRSGVSSSKGGGDVPDAAGDRALPLRSILRSPTPARDGRGDSSIVEPHGIPPLPFTKGTSTMATEIEGKSGVNGDGASAPSVRFGEVRVREYRRAMGLESVPTDGGGWPLGLSNEIVSDSADATAEGGNVGCCSWDVSSYERHKSEIRRSRAEAHAAHARHQGESGCDDTKGRGTKNQHGTSGKDHKGKSQSHRSDPGRGGDNPHFAPVPEQWRRSTILMALDPNYHFKQPTIPCSPPSSPRAGCGSGGKHHGHHHGHGSHHQHHGHGQQQRGSGYKNAELEHEGMIVRNELEKLRNERSVVGCDCRKPTHEAISGGGRHGRRHRKGWNERKLREELRKRHIDVCEKGDGSGGKSPNKKRTREDLAALLQEAIDEEPCCRDGASCPCVKNGVGCHADVCSCWFASHSHSPSHGGNSSVAEAVTTSGSGDGNVSANDHASIIRRCGNRYGMDVVDRDSIRSKRDQFVVQNLTCFD